MIYCKPVLILFIYLPIYLFPYLFNYLPINLFTHLFIYYSHIQYTILKLSNMKNTTMPSSPGGLISHSEARQLLTGLKCEINYNIIIVHCH